MATTKPKTPVSVHAAKTHLSRLIEAAEQGDETVITRDGRPVARLVPYRPELTRRVPGMWRGSIVMSPGSDEVDEEIARSFGATDW